MSTELTETVEYGPAMNALTPIRRGFVIAYCTNGCDATNAAREAGYIDNGTGAIRVTAHRTLHRSDVRAAIREWTIAAVQAKLPIYKQLLDSVAENPQHKDQTKAILALMDRGGMPAVVERNVNVNVTLTTQEKVQKLRQLLANQGKTEEEIAAQLGSVTDLEIEGEYKDITPPDFDPDAY